MRLAVEDIQFSYGSNPVLRGITIPDMPQSKITAAIGPNAAGKTTFFKCIAGLLKPRGSILLDGVHLREYKKEEVTRHVLLPASGESG